MGQPSCRRRSSAIRTADTASSRWGSRSPPSANDGMRIADILLNDIPQTGVSMTASVRCGGQTLLSVPPSSTIGKDRQECLSSTVDVELPPRELIAIGGGTEVIGELLYYIYRGDAVVAFQRTGIGLEGLPRNRVLDSHPLHFAQKFELQPGHYVAKVIARFRG